MSCPPIHGFAHKGEISSNFLNKSEKKYHLVGTLQKNYAYWSLQTKQTSNSCMVTIFNQQCLVNVVHFVNRNNIRRMGFLCTCRTRNIIFTSVDCLGWSVQYIFNNLRSARTSWTIVILILGIIPIEKARFSKHGKRLHFFFFWMHVKAVTCLCWIQFEKRK